MPSWASSHEKHRDLGSPRRPCRRITTAVGSPGAFLSPSLRSLPRVSCVEITPEMAYLLDACRSWPLSRDVLAQLQETPEWDQARAWGWIMETGRLTGMGATHAPGELPRGIIV